MCGDPLVHLVLHLPQALKRSRQNPGYLSHLRVQYLIALIGQPTSFQKPLMKKALSLCSVQIAKTGGDSWKYCCC